MRTFGLSGLRIVLAALQHAQQARLRGQWQFADFVEKQGAALRGLHQAGAELVGLVLAEQFGLDRLFRHRGAVEGDEGRVAAPALLVQRACDQFLAGSRFADDQHRGLGRCDLVNTIADLAHARRSCRPCRSTGKAWSTSVCSAAARRSFCFSRSTLSTSITISSWSNGLAM